jgi:hypothetical protein
MHLLGICALVIALAVLLIIGFLDVAQDLLSRDAFAAPSSSNEPHSEHSQEVEHDYTASQR